jgi:hypothetical protein
MKTSELRQLIKEEISKIEKQTNTIKENDIFNGTYIVSDEAYERMNALTNRKDLLVFLNSASKIMRNLTDDGFEAKDVFYYLYTRLIADV